MTVAQIAAVISLLLAFNVPQATVNNVQAILQNTKTAQTSSSVTATSPTVAPSATLSVKLGVVSVTRPGKPAYAPYHVHMEWSTNIPTNSKVFFAPIGQWQDVNPDGSINSSYFLVAIGNALFGYVGSTAPVIVNSASGVSTIHSAELNNLQENYRYSYTIEAISGTQDQKITGTFDTH